MFDRRESRLLEKLVEIGQEQIVLLKKLLHNQSRIVTGFNITQQGDPMALLPIAPGFSPVFTATPTPAGTALGAGIVATTTSSDTVNAPVTTDSTGLIATVAIPTTAVVGTSFTLTTTATNADGTVATGSASFTIVAAPSPDVTGFTITQTS
jgi:hypothetical protein